MVTLCEYAHAKINLHLDVLGRMEDGYHRVETVMQTLTLCDEVTLTPKEGAAEGITLSCDAEGVPTDERNLAFRAVRLYFERLGRSVGVHIHIVKRIPMAAGLAGGSADAAAALRGINRLMGEPYSMAELCAIGASIGADVPFCIAEGSALAEGRGERLHAFPPMPDATILVACEGEGVSTPWAYRLLDERWADFSESSSYVPQNTRALRRACETGDLRALCQSLYNVFEAPVLAQRPVASALKQRLAECAEGAMMSGSGPSVFGIFAEESVAREVREHLAREGICAHLCHPYTPNKM